MPRLHALTSGPLHLALALPILLCAACDGQGGPVEPEPTPAGADERLTVVTPGKEDNFLSTSAQEYMLTGSTTLTLEAEWATRTPEERLARAQALVPFRQTVIGWFLNAYMVEKGHDATNKAHGGFKALTKNGSWEDLNLVAVDDLTFSFDFRQEIAGPLNLLAVLPTTVDADGKRWFDLAIGRVSTEEMQRMEHNNEWYRKAPWSSFDPATLDAERLDTVRLSVEAEPRSADAWFDYARLVDDGVLDVGVHFGWDYHKEYHRVHSRSIYEWLLASGFTSPVARYEDLRRDSGALKKSMLTPLGPVEVHVSLHWGEPGTDTDPDTDAGGEQLEADMRHSLAHRDVIVFSGHSGPFYGFALANWRKTDAGDLDDSELSSVEMPEGRYQVVLAEGCDTYAIGQGFFSNPSKADRAHLDIITTTSFSNAGTANTVRDFLSAFVFEDKAPRLGDLLTDLDNNSYWFSTMYGVHGIDDNPHRHPWAAADALCGECAVDADCGGVGNRCVGMAGGQAACTFECTADDACPEGFVCQAAQSNGWIRTQVCVTAQATCEAPVAPEAPARVYLSEVMPNPAEDANGDGVFDSRDDEYAVITNDGDATADLGGWSLADTVGVRFTFPLGYVLAGGAQVTVYGGGAAEWTATRSLGLNNSGDTLSLLDARGAKRHSVTWRRAALGAVVVGDPLN